MGVTSECATCMHIYNACLQRAYAGVHAQVEAVIAGVQRFTVPSTGTWKITAFGAAGGYSKINSLYHGGQVR